MKPKTVKSIQEFSFVLPAIVLFALFVVYPFISGFPMSFTKWDGMSPTRTFVGIRNYISFFQDKSVWNGMKNTIVFTVLSVIGSNILGLALALMIHRTCRLHSISTER